MTALRLYLDEDATSKRLLQALRNRGMDVTSVLEAKMLAQSDEQQLEWASKHQCAIYSFNVRDFYRIHSSWLAQGKLHTGIILGKQAYSIGDQMRGLLRVAAAKSAEDIKNNVEFLGSWIR